MLPVEYISKAVGDNSAQAEVCAKTFLSNALKSNQALILETEILDTDGNRVGTFRKESECEGRGEECSL